MATSIYSEILGNKYQYFVDKVKKPLIKALVILSKRYPEPTEKNTTKHISHVLLDIWDEFFTWEDNPGRNELFRAIKRITVCVVESDTYYSQRITWFLKRLTEKYISGEWTPLEPWAPMECWGDPNVKEKRKEALRVFKQTLEAGGGKVLDANKRRE